MNRSASAWRFGAVYGYAVVAMCAGGWLSADRAEAKVTGGVPDAERLVSEALAAEAAGDAGRRESLLAEALQVAPDYRPARWHSGQIHVDGDWHAIDDVQQSAANDPRRAEYDILRHNGAESRDGQLALARWCRANGLDDEARYHWTTLLSYDPQNAEALRALGVRWFGGRLMTRAEIESAKAQAKRARHAARKYASDVARWQRKLAAGDLHSHSEALDEIRALRDAQAISALEEVTLRGNLTSHARFERAMHVGLAMVEALDQIPGTAATESLLRHAALSPVSDVRKAATAALKKRPQHDYVPLLLGELVSPIESSFRVTTDSDGSIHYWHSLYRSGHEANWAVEGRSSVFQHDMGSSTVVLNELPGRIVGEERESDASVAAKKAVVAAHSQRRFATQAVSIQREVNRTNEQVAASNNRVIPVLMQVTEQSLGDDPRSWWDWWDRENDYYTYTEGERPTYERRYTENELKYYREPEYVSASARHSCFAPGTLVWTKSGPRAIETIDIGDFVLAQDTASGELAYKPVIGRTLRPNRRTVDVQCGNDSLQATLGHLMWVSGSGWKMAKELQPGDVLHGVNELALVDSVEAAEPVDVYNLIVADWHNYFVGEAGILVHDNSPRTPTTAVVPGLTAQANAAQRP